MPEAESIIESAAADTETLLSHVELMKGPQILRRAMGELTDKGAVVYGRDEDEGGSGWLSSVAEAIPTQLWPEEEEALIDVSGEPLAERLAPELIKYRRGLTVEALGRSRLIQVSFAHTDPKLAAAGANSLADAYVNIRREEQLAVGNDAVNGWSSRRLSFVRSHPRRTRRSKLSDGIPAFCKAMARA